MAFRRAVLIVAVWASFADVAAAQQVRAASLPATPQLRGLSSAEADALIEKLRVLQRRLGAGESLFFELLSGAPASYPMTQVPPRQAFLDLPLENVFSVERVPTTNRLWQPHRLAIAPNGPGRLMWDVEVVLDLNGNVERVQMIHRAPPPS